VRNTVLALSNFEALVAQKCYHPAVGIRQQSVVYFIRLWRLHQHGGWSQQFSCGTINQPV